MLGWKVIVPAKARWQICSITAIQAGAETDAFRGV
jgi:hypothetical protein